MVRLHRKKSELFWRGLAIPIIRKRSWLFICLDGKNLPGKMLPPKLQGQMFCEIKKRIRQEKKTLEIKKKPHTLWKWLSYAAVGIRMYKPWNWFTLVLYETGSIIRSIGLCGVSR